MDRRIELENFLKDCFDYNFLEVNLPKLLDKMDETFKTKITSEFISAIENKRLEIKDCVLQYKSHNLIDYYKNFIKSKYNDLIALDPNFLIIAVLDFYDQIDISFKVKDFKKLAFSGYLI